MIELGEVWTVRAHGELLGSIEVTDVDMFWLRGHWLPEPTYAPFAPLFAEKERCGDEERWEDFEAAQQAIEAAGVTLHRPDGSAVAEHLIGIHPADGSAGFRFSDEPFVDEEPPASDAG